MGRSGLNAQEPLAPTQLAWVAGVLDAKGYLGRRRSGERELPTVSVTLQADSPVVRRLCELTGVSPIPIGKEHRRRGCAEHCTEPHVHVTGPRERWIVTGVKARLVLEACLPYLVELRAEAEAVLQDTQGQPYKPASVLKMAAWRGPSAAG